MTTLVEQAKETLAKGKQIGLDLAIDLTKEVAQSSKGLDYVYINEEGHEADPEIAIGCLNVHYLYDEDGLSKRDPESGLPLRVPGCLVGTVFTELYSIDQVSREGSAITTNDDFGDPFDEQAEQFLVHAQMSQDSGESWGEAISSAAEKVRAAVENGEL